MSSAAFQILFYPNTLRKETCRTLLRTPGIATRSKDATRGLLALLLGTMFAIRNKKLSTCPFSRSHWVGMR